MCSCWGEGERKACWLRMRQGVERAKRGREPNKEWVGCNQLVHTSASCCWKVARASVRSSCFTCSAVGTWRAGWARVVIQLINTSYHGTVCIDRWLKIYRPKLSI